MLEHNALSNKTLSVLHVEDDLADAAVVRRLIGKKFELTQAGSLEEAIDKLSENTYDVLLVDLNLPDSTGLNSLHKVLAKAPSSPVVVLTGNDNEEFGLQAVNDGAEDYVVKSYISSGNLLTNTLMYAVGRHQRHKEASPTSPPEEEGSLFSSSNSSNFKEMHPNEYDDLVQRYQAFLVDSCRNEANMDMLAQDTTSMLKNAGAQITDTVEIHSQVVHQCKHSFELRAIVTDEVEHRFLLNVLTFFS
ncbi:response regulator [Alteromonas sp. a30]|uniref:response regulator n=1 Tax=Alteromonas sp. a30 TaxID=2730917 RepID=UPI0022828CF3|nr:response regulator [Alteromonas sp. a30]MCY7296714.1 response regulator [Alteromonas sp. a30]